MENNDDIVNFENEVNNYLALERENHNLEVGNNDAEIVNVNNDNCNLNDLSKKQKNLNLH
jgi:hypothetical protein